MYVNLVLNLKNKKNMTLGKEGEGGTGKELGAWDELSQNMWYETLKE